MKNGSEVRNLYKSIGDPPSGGIKSVTEGVLVSPFLLAVLGAGGSLLLFIKIIYHDHDIFNILNQESCSPSSSAR